MLSIIDFAQFDKDIILPNITDSIEKDFSNKDLEKIDFEYLKNEFNKFKNFNFSPNIFIESFSNWVWYSTHYFINSNWSYKIQKDNYAFYMIELFWENEDKRDSDYKYVNIKNFPIITNEIINNIQINLLNKIWDFSATITPWSYDISLDREVVIDFLDIIIWNLSAEEIREWVSLFSKNKLWDKIFCDKITIINNPDLEGYTWTMLFDKEWITAKKTVLFDKWVLVSKFYDYKNALKEWLHNLWNSTVSNIEILWEIDKNYLVWSKILFTNLMAFHTVDSITWKFSLNWEWYLLENWEKKEFIKNISLTWDIINLFSNIKSIWNDFKTDWNFKVWSISFYNQKVG